MLAVPDKLRAGVLPALCMLALFAAYVATVSGALPAGDSGELIAAACSFGVAHPPGYPLFTALGGAAMAMAPAHHAALVGNLLSALLAALACGFLAATVRRLGGGTIGAVTAALVLGTSAVFWQYAIVAEVFAGNACLAAVLLFLAAREEAVRPRDTGIFVGVAVAGVAAHHTSLVLVALPLSALMLWRIVGRGHSGSSSEGRTRRHLVAALLGCALGLAPIAYLPIAASRGPILNWGDPQDATGLVNVLTRADYGSSTLLARETEESLIAARGESVRAARFDHAWGYLREAPARLGYLAPLLALAGAIALARDRRRRPLALALAGCAGLGLLFFSRANMPKLDLHLGVLERFFILPDVGLALLAGIGIGAIVTRLPAGRAQVAGAVGLAVVAIAPPAIAHLRTELQRDVGFSDALGRNLLASIPQRALVFSRGDMVHNALHYRILCLGERPDVIAIDAAKTSHPWFPHAFARAHPELALPPDLDPTRALGRGERGRAWIEAHLPSRPIVTFNPGPDFDPRAVDNDLVPWGLVQRVFPKDAAPSHAEQLATFEDLAARLDLEAAMRPQPQRSFERDTAGIYAGFLARLAFLRELAARHATATGDTAQATNLLARSGSAWQQLQALPDQAPAIATAMAATAHAFATEAGDPVRARAVYAEALGIDGRSLPALLGLAALYGKVPALDGAAHIRPLIEAALDVQPDRLDALKALSTMATQSRDRALAQRVLVLAQRAIDILQRRHDVARNPGVRAADASQIENLQHFVAAGVDGMVGR